MCSVPDLLRSIIDFYRSRLEESGINVETRYRSNGELFMQTGPLRQAFSNLLLNAADAMPQGGKLHVRVAAFRELAGQHRPGLRVTFADNGWGVKAVDLPRIMEPFFTTKGSHGTGIGLTQVQDAVRQHGGVFRVRSSTRHGRSGTIFTLFLPFD
jgi:two-component system CheB/CheR fusion protein